VISAAGEAEIVQTACGARLWSDRHRYHLLPRRGRLPSSQFHRIPIELTTAILSTRIHIGRRWNSRKAAVGTWSTSLLRLSDSFAKDNSAISGLANAGCRCGMACTGGGTISWRADAARQLPGGAAALGRKAEIACECNEYGSFRHGPQEWLRRRGFGIWTTRTMRGQAWRSARDLRKRAPL